MKDTSMVAACMMDDACVHFYFGACEGGGTTIGCKPLFLCLCIHARTSFFCMYIWHCGILGPAILET